MKMMQGALDLAFSKRSRTREAPTPTNISTNSDAATEKNGTPASPATALASSVFPVPGGPLSSTPFGILAPRLAYLSGCLRKSTTSRSSCTAPSTPATSEKRTGEVAASLPRSLRKANGVSFSAPGPPRSRRSATMMMVPTMTAGTMVKASILDSRSSGGTSCGTLASNSDLDSATMTSMPRDWHAANRSCAAAASSTVAMTRPSRISAPAPLLSGDNKTAHTSPKSRIAKNSE